MKEVALSWALKEGDWGRGCLAFQTERELTRAQTFKHWCIWGGEWWEIKWEL